MIGDVATCKQPKNFQNSNDMMNTNKTPKTKSHDHLYSVIHWVAVDDELPKIPINAPSYAREIKVIAAWGTAINNCAEMRFCRRTVRGKDVERFEWMGKISPWDVKFWAYFPEPPCV